MASNLFSGIQDPGAKVRTLCEYGSSVEVDKTISPKLYFRSGREMLRMANMYCDEGNLESAFILYSKYITLFVEKLPSHPDYKTGSSPADILEIKRRVPKVFPLAEEIKSKLKKKYQEEEKRIQEEEKKKQEALFKEAEKRKKESEKQMLEDEAFARQLQAEAEEKWLREQEDKYKHLQHQEERRLALEKKKLEEEESKGVIGAFPYVENGGNVSGFTSKISAESLPSPSPSIPDRELKKILVISDQSPLQPSNSSTFPSVSPPPYTPPIPSVDRSTKPIDHFMSIGLFGGAGGLREVIIPVDLTRKFTIAADKNTQLNSETMGILCGKVSGCAFKITHLFVPRQRGTPDSCDMENEEEIIFYQDKYDLITLGWIHTHPTQTAFLSSVDLHSHYGYQKMLPEAIAIVISPKFQETGIFSLTDKGMDVIGSCREKGFHYHAKEPPLFETSPHARMDRNESVVLTDMRK